MKANELIKKLIDNELEELHTALPAKIESYDPEKLRAKITLLAKKELEDENVTIPPILEVPVAHFKAGPFIIRPPYNKGDKVQVIFNERALDKIMITGDPEEVEFKRKHSFDDAVIIKGLKMEKDEDYPSGNSEDFLIYNQDSEDKFVIKKTGGVEITANNIYLGSENASEKVALLSELETLITEIKSHVHPTPSGPSSQPSTNFSDPSGSQKVVVE